MPGPDEMDPTDFPPLDYAPRHVVAAAALEPTGIMYALRRRICWWICPELFTRLFRLRDERDHYWRAAYIDAETGLRNKAAFDVEMEQLAGDPSMEVIRFKLDRETGKLVALDRRPED